MYNPLKVFVMAGGLAAVIGAAPILRFIYFFAIGQGNGHVQSLVIGGSLIVLGVVAIMFGAVADLVGRNRQLMEQALERLHHLEDQLHSVGKQAAGDQPSAPERRDGTHG